MFNNSSNEITPVITDKPDPSYAQFLGETTCDTKPIKRVKMQACFKASSNTPLAKHSILTSCNYDTKKPRFVERTGM